MSVISVDFGSAGKHDAKGAAGALAEATRAPRPDGSSWSHGQYHHRDWEAENQYWTNDKWHNDYNTAIEQLRTKGTEKAIRKDAVVLRSLVFQGSPEFFYPKIAQEHWTPEMVNDPRRNLDRGELDQEHVQAFYDSILTYAQDKWGDRLLSVQLHVDEATPHVHVQIVPITDDGRLCNKELIDGGRKGAKAFVDEIAARIGKPLGMDRAREMTPEEALQHEGHKSPDAVVTQLMDQERKRLELIKTQNDTLEKSIDELSNVKQSIPEPFTRKMSNPEYRTNLLGQKTDKETEESKQRRSEELEQIKSDRKQWFRDNYRNVQTVLADHARVSDELEERNKTVKRLESEIAQLKSERSMYNRISELTREVRSIPLEQILQDNGYVLDESVSNRVHRQWRNAEDRKVCVSNGTTFIDNHDPSFCGRGPIDLLMCINHGSTNKEYYKETVAQLADMYGIVATRTALESDPSVRQHPVVREAIKTASESILSAVPRPVYTLPAHHPKKRPQAMLWAVHRGLTERTMDHLLTSQQMLLDERGDIIIPRINGGWFERGTYGAESNRFKKVVGGKESGVGLIRGPEAGENADLIVCESVSDALALVQEFPSAEIAIIGGNLRPEIPRKTNQSIYLAFDNDEKGRAHFAHYLKIFPDAKSLFPPSEIDWSDYVKCKPEIEAKNARKRAEMASVRKAKSTDLDTESGTSPRPRM